MDLNIDLKNINVGDLKEKLKAVDKKTLIKFGIGFAAIIIFLIGYKFLKLKCFFKSWKISTIPSRLWI